LVEVCPLTLFLTFFKSNLKRLFCFILIAANVSFIRHDAYGLEREISLYPFQDIQLVEDTEETKIIRIGITESIANLKILPCLFLFNPIPLLYSVVQGGVSCGMSTSKRNNISLSIIPETNLSNENGKKGLALGVGFADSFDLTKGKRAWLATGSINYKFWDNQLMNSSYHISTSELIQLWGNVFDSNISLGFLHNSENKNDSLKSTFSTYFYYLQSLPLEMRQIGGVRNTASLEYKSIGVSFRKEAFHFIVFGIGIAYWNLTFDGIKISGPLPNGYLSIAF
jgi:hypothetical protein